MNAQMTMNTQMKPTPILQHDITPEGSDYEVVRRAIEKISLDYRDQPSLEALAADVGETPTGLQKLFTRWAGLSPKPSCRRSPSTMRASCSIPACRSWKHRSSLACPAPAGCMISSSPMKRCRRAITRRAAPG